MSQAAKDTVSLKITIPARLDKKMGMGVIHSAGKVFITSIIPGSLASEYLRVKDRIVSINGVNVKDKKHVKELILSASTESEFDVYIERRSTAFQLPVVPPAEVDAMPDLQFTAEPSKKKTPSKPKKPKPPRKPEAAIYDGFLGDDEFAYGNPLDGVILPAPEDVRNILRSRMPQILNDFMTYEVEKIKGSTSQRSAKDSSTSTTAKSIKSPGSLSTRIESKNIIFQNIASDVPSQKQLMKPRTH